MKTKATLAIVAIAAALTMITSGMLAIAPAYAVQRNNLGISNQAGSNTQTGLVNLGNTQVGANVGANVCALSVNC